MPRRAPHAAAKPRFLKIAPRRPQSTLLQALNARFRRILLTRPALYWTVVPAYRRFQRAIGRLFLLASGTPCDDLLDIYRDVNIEPGAVRDVCGLPFSVLRNTGPGWVLGGDWDLDTERFADDPRYIAIRDVMTRGAPWEQTESYQQAVERIDHGTPVWYCRTRTEYDQRCRAVEALYHQIEANGYLSQRQLRERRPAVVVVGRGDEVSVAIGRGGDFLFIDGAHRLAIAKLLNVPSIPVEVRLRHADWMAFRLELADYCAAHGGMAPQPLLHPDLGTVPSRPGWSAAFELIARHLGDDPVAVVDLDARWGYMCHRLEAAGIECIAVETDSRDRAFLSLLRRACGRRFTVLGELEVTELPEKARRQAVVFALASEDRPANAARLRRLAAEMDRLEPREAYVSSEGVALVLLQETGAFTRRSSLGHVRGIGEIFRLSKAPGEAGASPRH
jgi:hypothetical protein